MVVAEIYYIFPNEMLSNRLSTFQNHTGTVDADYSK
jgi:hypothetical protein